MNKVSVAFCLFSVLCFACTENGGSSRNSTAAEAEPGARVTSEAAATANVHSVDPELDSLLEQFFSPPAATFLRELDRVFTTELRRQSAIRPVDFLYTTHLAKIRTQVIDRQSFNHLFPFRPDDPRLADFGDAENVEFLSNKCGFQVKTSGQTVHFLCLYAESSLYDFLNGGGDPNALIASFSEGVKKNGGTVPPDFIPRFALRAGPELDFTYPPHRLFYALVHFLLVEESEAMEQVAAIRRETAAKN